MKGLPRKSALVAAIMGIVLLTVDVSPGQDVNRERLRDLKRELKEAREKGNQAEVQELQELIRKLTAGAKTDDEKEDEVDLRPRDDDITVQGGGLSLRFGRNGQIKEVVGKGAVRYACKGATIYRIENKRATVSAVERTEGGLRVSVKVGGRSAEVLIEGGDDITVEFHGDNIRYVTFGFGLPRSTKFHQAKHNNLVEILDERLLKQGPIRSFWGWGFQILVAELDGGFLSVSGRSDYKKAFLGRDRAYISRCRARGKDLAFEYTWRPEFPLVLSWHDSLESAAAQYRKWMQGFFHLKLIKDTPGVEWLEGVKLVITFDMGLSNGAAAHNYQDLIDLAKELYQAGAKGGILFYLPSWYGKYDAEYPDYTPKDWLGGEEKFKEMVDVLHACGYRVLLHFNPWGADPFSPELSKIKHLAVKSDDEMSREELLVELEEARRQNNQAEVQEIQALIKRLESKQPQQREHPPVGWPACYPAKESDYDSGRQRLAAKRNGNVISFSTVPLPRTFEAHISLGGIPLDTGRVKLSTNARSLFTPKAHFSSHETYTFPYTFLLYQGENDVTLEFPDGEIPDLSRAWYRIHDAIYSDAIHTYPIVRMDTANDDWVKIFSDRVIEVVRKYKIDAVHLDASHLWDLNDSNMKINRRLLKALPHVAFSTEIPSEPSLMMYQLAQTGVVPEDVEDKEYSPLAELISKPYKRLYRHLCAAEGFVPVAKVCNVRRRLRPYTEQQLEWNRQVYRLSPRFGLIRNIRVNYRDFGLDAETKKAVLSLYSRD